VGHLGLDDTLGGQWFPDTYKNLVVDSNLPDRVNDSNRGHCLRKVGAGTLTFSGKYLRKYEINDGTLLITNDAAFVWTKDASTYRSRITFGGGTLAFGGDVTDDPSSRIVESTAPICFSNAVNEVHTWATALVAQVADAETGKDAGLVKLGEGTLVLSAAPLYTGDTYLDTVGGTLKIPAAAGVRVKTHVENKAVRRASETIDDVVYTVYTLGNKPGSMIILF
jgi:autotransporter-associated beta strand protein